MHGSPHAQPRGTAGKAACPWHTRRRFGPSSGRRNTRTIHEPRVADIAANRPPAPGAAGPCRPARDRRRDRRLRARPRHLSLVAVMASGEGRRSVAAAGVHRQHAVQRADQGGAREAAEAQRPSGASTSPSPGPRSSRPTRRATSPPKRSTNRGPSTSSSCRSRPITTRCRPTSGRAPSIRVISIPARLASPTD